MRSSVTTCFAATPQVQRWGEIYNAVLLAWSLGATVVCGAVAVRDEDGWFGIVAAAGLLIAALVAIVSSLPSGIVT